MQQIERERYEKKNTRSQKIVWLFVGFITGTFVILLFNFFTNLPSIADVNVRINDSNYKFINPLLECENGGVISEELQGFKKEVVAKVDEIKKSNKAEFISVYFRDMNNGPWFGINELEPFSPASLLKVPIMMMYYKKSESDPTLLQKTITFAKPANTYTEYFATSTIAPDHTYTIEELIRSMIIYSDNDAMDLLITHVNDYGVDPNDVFKYLNVDLSQKGLLTVKQYSTFFRILFNASYLDYNHSEKALSLLSELTFTQGLKSSLPNNVQVSHKFGERWDFSGYEKQLHDCGIVYYPKHPYLLCIMTRGDNFDTLASTISEISTFVYMNVDKQFSRLH